MFFISDNFATTNDRKTWNTSKVSEFSNLRQPKKTKNKNLKKIPKNPGFFQP